MRQYLDSFIECPLHASKQECVKENYFSCFSTKTYDVGTQKNCLNETVLLSTHKKFKLMDKKKITILHSKFSLSVSMPFRLFD